MYSKKRQFFKVLQNDLREIIFQLQEAPSDEVATRKLRELSTKAFSRSKSLSKLWKKYEQHLVVLDEIQDDRHYSGNDPEAFFNLESILAISQHTYVSTPIWTAVPQALTSIGIIGTFSSICEVLLSNSGSIDDSFIKGLVSAVAIGFISSIVGVLLAVCFMMYEKINSHGIANQTDTINQSLTGFFPLLTTDALLHAQVMCLKNLSRDIGASISSGFSDMTGNLGPALADIIDDDTKKIVKDNIATSFIEMNNILAGLRDEAKGLFSEMEEIRRSKQEILESMINIKIDQARIQQDINDQTSSLGENLRTLERTLAPLREVANQVQATNDLSNRLISSVSEVTSATKSIQDVVAQSAQLVSDLKPQMLRLSDEYKGLSTNIESWVGQSNVSVQNNLKEFDQHIASVLDRVTIISNSLNTGVSKLDQSINKWVDKKAEIA